jgi:sugar/nucleoside kinase (ribokinase family)
VSSGRPAILVIGDAILDVHAWPTIPIEEGADIPAAIQLSPGGQGANLAVRLARQGLDVTLACALSDDPAGRILRAALDADGVARSEAAADSTGVVVVLGDDRGERSMLSQRARLPRSLVDGTATPDTWLVVSGYVLLQDDGPILAARLAAHHGPRVLAGCAVPNDRLDRWHAGLAALRPDLVVANREEAERTLDAEHEHGWAITDASGAEVTIGEVHARADVPTGPPAVDTTGAGDAFAAGLIAGLAGASWPPTEPVLRVATERGVALASAVARQLGAQAPVAGERPATLRR